MAHITSALTPLTDCRMAQMSGKPVLPLKIHKNKCSVHAHLFPHNFLTLEVYTGVIEQSFCMLFLP